MALTSMLPNVFQITPLMAAADMIGSVRSGGGPAPIQGDVQEHAIRTMALLLANGANINAHIQTAARTPAR